MLTLNNVRLHLQRARLATETINEETSVIAALGLALEPLTPALAKQLGHDIAEHCFTKDGSIRPEFTRYQFRLRLSRQMATIRMAEDSKTASAVLRQVVLSSVTILKRGEPKGGKVEKKGKKIAPQGETLRLVLGGHVSIAEREHRDFLAQRFGDTMLWVFEDEEHGLPLGSDDEDDAEDEAEPIIPGLDVGAGDVLEEQAAHQAAAAPRRSRKSTAGPKLIKGKKGVH